MTTLDDALKAMELTHEERWGGNATGADRICAMSDCLPRRRVWAVVAALEAVRDGDTGAAARFLDALEKQDKELVRYGLA